MKEIVQPQVPVSAGKGSHHTDGWSEPGYGDDGLSYVETIQRAAKEAANSHDKLVEALRKIADGSWTGSDGKKYAIAEPSSVERKIARAAHFVEDEVATRAEDGPTAPIAVETADGFVVVSRKLANVIQPYQYKYDLDWFATAQDAHDHYTDIENGDHHGWEPIAILPAFKGVPLGSKRLPT